VKNTIMAFSRCSLQRSVALIAETAQLSYNNSCSDSADIKVKVRGKCLAKNDAPMEISDVGGAA